MDSRLSERLTKWHEQIKKVQQAEGPYFSMDGQEKHFLHSLAQTHDNKSKAEKESQAYASNEWAQFKIGLAQAKTKYNNELRLLDLSKKAYEAEYLDLKITAEAIRKHP